ncbi:MAG: hypothetical protein LLG04_08060 [Parachlamydia sp.]|nr:hypothetical protein [Parachlamydia sp.]
MKITIAERLHPFSHVPGIACMLPGSSLKLQIFPTLLRLYDLASFNPELKGEATLTLTGPVKDFTVLQDLERCEITVFGQAQEGYFRYHCRANEGGMFIEVVKASIQMQSHAACIQLGVTSTLQKPLDRSLERLSLGWHKAQDWTQMQRRLALEELLPLWHRLGQMTPKPIAHAHEGSALMLDACRELIAKSDREALVPAFQKLFLAGFTDLFIPRLEDDQNQGFALLALSQECQLSPLILLTEGTDLIRSLFVQQENNAISILPALPPQFHCGRLVGIECEPCGSLDMEWSKKQIRRLKFRAKTDGQVQFLFQPELKEFRLRAGSRKEIMACGDTLSIEKGQEYLLDNFRR